MLIEASPARGSNRRGMLFALADMDHVYEDCKHGLIENIRFLYRMMADLKARGLKVFAVGKAYDDDLYAWLYDKSRGDLEYRGMKVVVFQAPKTVEDFKKFSYGLQMVSPSLVMEALREGKSLTRETHISYFKGEEKVYEPRKSHV